MVIPALASLDQPGKRWLLVVAAPAEARAVCDRFHAERPPVTIPTAWQEVVLDPRRSLLLTGVGKANAAGAVARVFNHARHAGVINLGVAGALPGSGLALCDAVLAGASVYADEGSENPDGYVDIARMGFAPNVGVAGASPSVEIHGSSSLAELLKPLCARTGTIATVSTCSGTDGRAAEVVHRTRAIAEAMEGAAVGFTIARLTGGAGRFAEVRVISNTTGTREGQVWNLREALGRLGELAYLL